MSKSVRSARSYQYSSTAGDFPGSDIESTFTLAFKKLAKKDQSTKQRAIEQIAELFDTTSEDDLLVIVAEWCNQFRKTPYFHSKLIREKMCRAMQILFNKGKTIRQQLSLHLQLIIPIWINLRFDFEIEVRSAALDLWNVTLNSTEKEQKALTLISSNFFTTTSSAFALSVKSLKEFHNLPEEEAEFVLENLVSSSLQGMVFIWESLRGQEKFPLPLEEFLSSDFWDAFATFSKYTYVRIAFYDIFRSILQFFPNVAEGHMKEITHHLLVQGLNEKESTILGSLWSPILLLINKYPSCWNHIDPQPHRTFFPRLFAMIRRAFGTFAYEATGRSMLPLIMCMPLEVIEKSSGMIQGIQMFGNEFLCSIFHGLQVVQRGGSNVLLDAYFECLMYLSITLPEKGGHSDDLFTYFISNHLLPVTIWQVYSASSRVNIAVLIQRLEAFIRKITNKHGQLMRELLWIPLLRGSIDVAIGNITPLIEEDETENEPSNERTPKDRTRKRREANRYLSPLDGSCALSPLPSWCERLGLLLSNDIVPLASCGEICDELVRALLKLPENDAVRLSCTVQQKIGKPNDQMMASFLERIERAIVSSLSLGSYSLDDTLSFATKHNLIPESSLYHLLSYVNSKAQEYSQYSLAGKIVSDSLLVAVAKAMTSLCKVSGKTARETDEWIGDGMEILRSLLCVMKNNHSSPKRYSLSEDISTKPTMETPLIKELPAAWNDAVMAMVHGGVMDVESARDFIEDLARETVDDIEFMVPSPIYSHETSIRVLEVVLRSLNLLNSLDEASSSSSGSTPLWSEMINCHWDGLMGSVLNGIVKRKLLGTAFEEFTDWLDISDPNFRESAAVVRLNIFAMFTLDFVLNPSFSLHFDSSHLKQTLFRLFSVQSLSSFLTVPLQISKLVELFTSYVSSIGLQMDGPGILSGIENLLLCQSQEESVNVYDKPLKQITSYSILHFVFTSFPSVSVAHIGLSLIESRKFAHLHDYIISVIIARSTQTFVSEHALLFISDTLGKLVSRALENSITSESTSLIETLCGLMQSRLEQKKHVFDSIQECTGSLIKELKTRLPSAFIVENTEKQEVSEVPIAIQSPGVEGKSRGLLSWFSWGRQQTPASVEKAPQQDPSPARTEVPKCVHFSEMLRGDSETALRICEMIQLLVVCAPSVGETSSDLAKSLVECSAAAVSCILSDSAIKESSRSILPLRFLPSLAKCLSFALTFQDGSSFSQSAKFLFGAAIAVFTDYSRLFVDILNGKPLIQPLQLKTVCHILECCIDLEVPSIIWLETDIQFGSVASQLIRIARDIHLHAMNSFCEGHEERFSADISSTPYWSSLGQEIPDSVLCRVAGRLIGKINTLVMTSLSVRSNRSKLVSVICQEDSGQPIVAVSLLEAAMQKKKCTQAESEEVNEPAEPEDEEVTSDPLAVPAPLRKILECPPPLAPSLYSLLKRADATKSLKLRKLTVSHVRNLFDAVESSAICRVLTLGYVSTLGWLIESKIDESVLLPWLRASNVIIICLDVIFAALLAPSGLESSVGSAAVVKGTFLDMSIPNKVRACLQLNSSVPYTGINPQCLAGIVLPCLRRVVMNYPSITRMWWNQGDKTCSDIFESFVMFMVSPELIESQLATLQENFTKFKEETGETSDLISQNMAGLTAGQLRQFLLDEEIHVSVSHETKSVSISFEKDGNVVALRIKIPNSYPLRQVAFEDDAGESGRKTRGGINYEKWRKWTLQMTRLLFAQNSTLWQCVVLWCSNLARMFSGVEPCPICYSVVSQANQRLPELKCKTCNNSFHSTCLLKWFKSSGNNTCPLCRTPWF